MVVGERDAVRIIRGAEAFGGVVGSDIEMGYGWRLCRSEGLNYCKLEKKV